MHHGRFKRPYGIILKEAEYTAMSNMGEPNTSLQQTLEHILQMVEHQIAEHKMSSAEYETHQVVESFL
jgi:hypothetical protein